ncbi:MAG: hypothetical protein ABSA83_02835 [Verrucomicrobiota bacterium]|jgi:hypothetical protein
MENPAVSKHTISFGLALALCAVLNALLVIAKEKSKGVAEWMQKMTGNHWVTHVAIVLVVYLVLGFGLAGMNRGQGSKTTVHRLTGIVYLGVIAGVLIVLGFYLVAD